MATASKHLRTLRYAVPLLLLLAAAGSELWVEACTRAAIIPAADWQAAAAQVRRAWRVGDVALSAPRWTDPLLRHALGERLSLEAAAHADLQHFRRAWLFRVRQAAWPALPHGSQRQWYQRFGKVEVIRYRLPVRTQVVADLVDALPDARVSIEWMSGGHHDCPWQIARPQGGGLLAGPIAPATRFQCDPKRPWLWVGETVLMDLDLRARRCIWQHPEGLQPVTVHFDNLPASERLVLHAGLDYYHERSLAGAPVILAVRVGGVELVRWEHHDGDGFRRYVLPWPAPWRGRRLPNLEVAVLSQNPHLRSLCWAGRLERVGGGAGRATAVRQKPTAHALSAVRHAAAGMR